MFLEDGTRKGIVLMRRESAGSERGGATAASLAPWARDQPDNVAHLQSAHAHIHPQHLASAHSYRPHLSRYEVSEHHDHLHHHHHHGGGGGGGGGAQHVYQHHGHEGYEMPQPEPRAGEHPKGGASYMYGDELFDYAEIGGEATGPPPPPPPTASARVLPPPTAASRPGEEASFYYRPPPTPPSPNAAHPLAFSRYEGDLDHHSLQVPRLEQRRYSSQHLQQQQQQQEPPQEQPQDTTPSGNHASLARGHTAAEDNQNEPQRGNQHHPRHSSHHPVRHDDPTSRPDASDTMKREHQARSHGGVMTRRSSLMVSPHARGENGYAHQHSSPHSRTPGTNAGALDPLASTQSEGAGRASIKRSRAEFDEASEPPGSPQSAKSAPNSYAKKRRRRWLNFEDELLRDSVQSYLDTQAPHHESSKIKIPWNKIAQLIPNRNAKQCRDRWQAMRGPHSKREWSMEDDLCLLQLQKRFSNRWVRIAAAFPDRNDNMVKSRFRVLSKLKITPEHLIAQIDRCNASKQARKAVVDDGRGSMPKPSIQEFDGHAPSHVLGGAHHHHQQQQLAHLPYGHTRANALPLAPSVSTSSSSSASSSASAASAGPSYVDHARDASAPSSSPSSSPARTTTRTMMMPMTTPPPPAVLAQQRQYLASSTAGPPPPPPTAASAAVAMRMPMRMPRRRSTAQSSQREPDLAEWCSMLLD